MKGKAMSGRPLVAAFILAGVLIGCTGEPPFESPKTYGDPVTQGTPVELREVLNDAASLDGKTILIEGVTGSVCQNRGCWMYISDGVEKIRVNFKDYGFFVPLASEGKRVKAEGLITIQHVSKETLRHWASEEKGGDPSSITADSTIVMFTASGIEMERGDDLSEEQKELMSSED